MVFYNRTRSTGTLSGHLDILLRSLPTDSRLATLNDLDLKIRAEAARFLSTNAIPSNAPQVLDAAPAGGGAPGPAPLTFGTRRIILPDAIAALDGLEVPIIERASASRP
jgi:hypothetical protein